MHYKGKLNIYSTVHYEYAETLHLTEHYYNFFFLLFNLYHLPVPFTYTAKKGDPETPKH